MDKKNSKEIVEKIAKVVKEKTSDGIEYVKKNLTNDIYYQEKLNIFKAIEKYQTIIIHRHIRVDGDAYGSSLGLRALLRASFPSKKIYSVGGEVPSYLHFLGSEDLIDDEVYQDSLVIVVDTSEALRIQDQRYKLAEEVIKIDHHLIVDQYGNINFVREDLPACALVIYDWYSTFQNRLSLTKEGALNLYFGIISDTGRFRYLGTSSETLRIAADLIQKGIDTERLYTNLYIKNLENIKLLGYVYNNFSISLNGVLSIYISRKVREKYLATEDEASSLVNSLDSVRGSLIWILFLEVENGIRVRMRSRFITIDDIASHYHGGGHAYASGATVYNKPEMRQLIQEADEKLQAYKILNKDVF